MAMTSAAMFAGVSPNRMIWVTFKVRGFHCYPGAPEAVAYLRERHRHQFGFRVWIEVFGDNREIEFHMTQAWLESLYAKDGVLEADGKSCEMLANELYARMVEEQRFQNRDIWIEVDEDGECGALMRYERGAR
ncbi:hypothetical protein [Methylorubrum extorquens]|uniref:hypothetical protein n=1 Tax=Methylorubrum extorquens TaxID=408 RepID=UPI0003215F77|nr:hypothetical protein [Methylorubrum extorquens]WIU39963.1 hypothetical protein KQ926_00830 [Methylorubrum extorquens]